MGWWSATVRGGDAPLDVEGTFRDIICGEWDWEGDDPMRDKDLLNSKMDEITEWFEKPYWQKDRFIENDSYGDDINIARQVIAYLIISVGAKLPDRIKELSIESANNDGWATRAEDRRMYMDQLVEALENYDETPTELKEEGLFDKMAAMFAGTEEAKDGG